MLGKAAFFGVVLAVASVQLERPVAAVWSATGEDKATVEAQTYFPNCKVARSAGAAPIYRGEPGYRSEMDMDDDGIACEPYRGM